MQPIISSCIQAQRNALKSGYRNEQVETIRYYEKIGLLSEQRRTTGNYRSYGEEHRQRLAFIRHARDLGFSIEDVRGLLRLAEHTDAPCGEVDQLVERHLQATERKIEALTRLHNELSNTLHSCRGGRTAECRILQALSR